LGAITGLDRPIIGSYVVLCRFFCTLRTIDSFILIVCGSSDSRLMQAGSSIANAHRAIHSSASQFSKPVPKLQAAELGSQSLQSPSGVIRSHAAKASHDPDATPPASRQVKNDYIGEPYVTEYKPAAPLNQPVAPSVQDLEATVKPAQEPSANTTTINRAFGRRKPGSSSRSIRSREDSKTLLAKVSAKQEMIKQRTTLKDLLKVVDKSGDGLIGTNEFKDCVKLSGMYGEGREIQRPSAIS